MSVKHIKIVEAHKASKGGETGTETTEHLTARVFSGFGTTDHPSQWVNINAQLPCNSKEVKDKYITNISA